MLIGKLNIDNETDDYNASQPRQTRPRVSVLVGKRSLSRRQLPKQAVANQRTPPGKLHGNDTFE